MIFNESVVGIKVKKNSVITEHKGIRFKKNGVITTVWVAHESYSVVFADYPLTEVSASNCDYKNILSANNYTLSARKGSGGGYGTLKANVSLPTKRCNKVKIKYSTNQYAIATINGNVLNSNVTDQYIEFDCSGDSFLLELEVSDNTAYYIADLIVSEVTFYYE